MVRVTMRRTVASLVLVILNATAAWCQSTLTFPKRFSAAEMQLSGFALVNSGTSRATAVLTVYSSEGTVVATSRQSIGAGGSLALTGSQLFPQTASGWVQVTSEAVGLQGFWLNYDLRLTSMDGGESAMASLDQVIPFVTTDMQVNIVNPNAEVITVSLDGVLPITLTIPARGAFQAEIGTLFPPAQTKLPAYLRMRSTQPFASTAVIRNAAAASETAVINGINYAATSQFVLPHVVSGTLGSANYSSRVGVVNLSGAAQNVTLVFKPDDGGSTAATVRTLDANGSLQASLNELFGLNSARFQNGWVYVTGEGPLTGFTSYSESSGGAFTVVPAQTTPRSTMMFAHIADASPFSTALALVNANSVPATVNVYAVSRYGVSIGGPDLFASAQVRLEPNAKTARLLSELVPRTRSRADGDGGFVFVQSNVPIFGIETIFSNNMNSLAYVAPSPVALGYTAPTVRQGVLDSVQTYTTSTGLLSAFGKMTASLANIYALGSASSSGTRALAQTLANAALAVVAQATAVQGMLDQVPGLLMNAGDMNALLAVVNQTDGLGRAVADLNNAINAISAQIAQLEGGTVPLPKPLPSVPTLVPTAQQLTDVINQLIAQIQALGGIKPPQ